MPLPKLSGSIFNTKLPSNGQKVDFRPMQAREDRMLLQLRAGNPKDDEILTTLAQVVQSCMVDQKLNALSMPIVDVEWLFLHIRMKSISEIANVSYIDKGDNRTYDFEIPLSKVGFEIDESIKNLIDLGGGIAIQLKWPSVADTIAVADLAPVDVAHQLAIRSIDKVFDDSDVTEAKDTPLEELEEFVNSLPIKNYQEVMDYLAAAPHLSYKIEFTNSKEVKREIILSTLGDFFTFA